MEIKKIKGLVLTPILGNDCHTWNMLPQWKHFQTHLQRRYSSLHLLLCKCACHFHKSFSQTYNYYNKLINKFLFSHYKNIDGRALVERRLKNRSGHRRRRASEACISNNSLNKHYKSKYSSGESC